jgi:hypothetical protein
VASTSASRKSAPSVPMEVPYWYAALKAVISLCWVSGVPLRFVAIFPDAVQYKYISAESRGGADEAVRTMGLNGAGVLASGVVVALVLELRGMGTCAVKLRSGTLDDDTGKVGSGTSCLSDILDVGEGLRGCDRAGFAIMSFTRSQMNIITSKNPLV